MDFLKLPIETHAQATLSPTENITDLRLEKVCFAYNDNRNVLELVDMNFPKGCITGILGESGVGKTTLADLLLRLREPDRGRILLNGRELRLYSENWLRRTFGFVDQEPFLFDTTIYNNFRIACDPLSDDQLTHSLEAASALDFVTTLPNGTETYVGEGGCLLSIGEKQRIALARVLAKKPRVLILDEITSSLDIENEKMVLSALRKLCSDMILILITHKNSVASHCDRLYTLDKGRVVDFKERQSYVG